MIALNIVLMVAVAAGLVSLLAWAIVSDRRSYRAAGGELPPSAAPLSRNLEMPHELRTRRHHTAGRTHSPRASRIANSPVS